MASFGDDFGKTRSRFVVKKKRVSFIVGMGRV